MLNYCPYVYCFLISVWLNLKRLTLKFFTQTTLCIIIFDNPTTRLVCVYIISSLFPSTENKSTRCIHYTDQYRQRCQHKLFTTATCLPLFSTFSSLSVFSARLHSSFNTGCRHFHLNSLLCSLLSRDVNPYFRHLALCVTRQSKDLSHELLKKTLNFTWTRPTN